MTNELMIRTQYDGKDYRSVEEICYVDDSGEYQTHVAATEACIDITTCADQGRDTWTWIKDQVEGRLKAHGIPYQHIDFVD